jgi:hypothetical protein
MRDPSESAPASLDVPPGTLEWVDRLHAVVDELARPIADAHATRLQCRHGCTACCADGLGVFVIEAALIQARHRDLLRDEAPAPEGGCAFLDETGGCRIYGVRPYVCRTQGLPLRWIEEDEETGGPVEARDICPLNDASGPPLEELPADVIWTIGPIEQRLADRQHACDGGEGRRVSLRSLFAQRAPNDGRRRLPTVR